MTWHAIKAVSGEERLMFSHTIALLHEQLGNEAPSATTEATFLFTCYKTSEASSVCDATDGSQQESALGWLRKHLGQGQWIDSLGRKEQEILPGWNRNDFCHTHPLGCLGAQLPRAVSVITATQSSS